MLPCLLFPNLCSLPYDLLWRGYLVSLCMNSCPSDGTISWQVYVQSRDLPPNAKYRLIAVRACREQPFCEV